MPAKDVHIRMQSGIPVAVPDPIKLGRDQRHTIDWHNDLNEEVTISFDKGTPFDHGHNPYKIGAGKRKNSGDIKVQPTATPWKYTIKTASGIENDPQVIVQPIVPDPPTN